MPEFRLDTFTCDIRYVRNFYHHVSSSRAPQGNSQGCSHVNRNERLHFSVTIFSLSYDSCDRRLRTFPLLGQNRVTGSIKSSPKYSKLLIIFLGKKNGFLSIVLTKYFELKAPRISRWRAKNNNYVN